MPIWCEDIELSKYSKYKAKNGLSENGTSSERAHVACSLAGVLLGGLHLLTSARVCLYWLCMRFRMAQVVSCHGRDTSAQVDVGQKRTQRVWDQERTEEGQRTEIGEVPYLIIRLRN